eukprot:59514_1
MELYLIKESHLPQSKNDFIQIQKKQQQQQKQAEIKQIQRQAVKQAEKKIIQKAKAQQIVQQKPLVHESKTPPVKPLMAAANDYNYAATEEKKDTSDDILEEDDDDEYEREDSVKQKDANDIIDEMIIEEKIDENEKYVFVIAIEKKGKNIWSQYHLRELKMTKGAILEYYEVVKASESKQNEANSEEQTDTKVLKGITDLIEENVNEIIVNETEGNNLKFGWQIKTDKGIYLFASATNEERAKCMKYIKYYYEKCDRLLEKRKEEQEEEKRKEDEKREREEEKKKRELDIIKKREEKKRKKAEKARQKRLKNRVDAAVDKSSIFGKYRILNDEYDEDEQEDDDNLINTNPLMAVTLNELMRENINSFESKLGVDAAQVDDIISFNNDLIVSNEYCQIAIGKGLIRDTKDDDDDYDDMNSNEQKQSQSKQKHELFNETADIINEGFSSNDKNAKQKMKEKISFLPGDRSFTLVCEVQCENFGADNVLFSNGKFECSAPRIGSKRIAIKLNKSELLNIGKTEIYQDIWYHIVIVCYRSSDDNDMLRQQSMLKKKKKKKIKKKDKMVESTDFRVFLNGVLDGKLSLKGIPKLDGKGRIGIKYQGEIKNFKIYYRALSDDNVYDLAQNKYNMSYSMPKLLTYIPSSLKVEIPIYDIKYNGPIGGKLPKHFLWQPRSMDSFTITAWIMCTRAVSADGSVIISNYNGHNGFELIAPTNKTNVIGLRCTGIRIKNKKQGLLTIGTKKIKTNKFYHIGITVERVITYGDRPDATSIQVFLNGQADGSYNEKISYDYKGDVWCIGLNRNNVKKTRFDGSISNLRIFKRALDESEIACIYAADLRERKFRKNEKILYLTQGKDNRKIKQIKQNDHLTYFGHLSWIEGVFVSQNMIQGSVTIIDSQKQKKILLMSNVIKTRNNVLTFIPGTDSKFVTHLGGMIHGSDFDGNKWRIYSSETRFLRYITTPSCLSQLTKLQPFPKHQFESMIDNKEFDNKYIVNRLLNAAFNLLKNININSKHKWPYFNEY